MVEVQQFLRASARKRPALTAKSMRCAKPCSTSAPKRSSIPIKDKRSPAMPSLRCSRLLVTNQNGWKRTLDRQYCLWRRFKYEEVFLNAQVNGLSLTPNRIHFRNPSSVQPMGSTSISLHPGRLCIGLLQTNQKNYQALNFCYQHLYIFGGKGGRHSMSTRLQSAHDVVVALDIPLEKVSEHLVRWK